MVCHALEKFHDPVPFQSQYKWEETGFSRAEDILPISPCNMVMEAGERTRCGLVMSRLICDKSRCEGEFMVAAISRTAWNVERRTRNTWLMYLVSRGVLHVRRVSMWRTTSEERRRFRRPSTVSVRLSHHLWWRQDPLHSWTMHRMCVLMPRTLHCEVSIL